MYQVKVLSWRCREQQEVESEELPYLLDRAVLERLSVAAYSVEYYTTLWLRYWMQCGRTLKGQ